MSTNIDTKRNWLLRKEHCLTSVYTSLEELIAQSNAPNNISLATFKPNEILEFEIVKDKSREWKSEWIELRKQGDLVTPGSPPENTIGKPF